MPNSKREPSQKPSEDECRPTNGEISDEDSPGTVEQTIISPTPSNARESQPSCPDACDESDEEAERRRIDAIEKRKNAAA